jgi:hypothetical protein
LGKTNTLTITGTGTNRDATVTIKPDTGNPQLIDVNVSTDNKVYTYPTQSISDIQVTNLGAFATLTTDTGLAVPGVISFDGGGNAVLKFNSLQPATTQVNKLRANHSHHGVAADRSGTPVRD